MGIGVESWQLLEVALEFGRPTELFLHNRGLATEVGGRMERAFQKAFMSGMFKYDISGEVFVGPTLLPSALPADTTPGGLLVRGPGDTTEKIMTGGAQTFGYTLERSTSNQMNELFLITKPGQQKILHPEIPSWGKYR
ncbi:unnamed protein product, partial [Sphacelaria rigidula]